MLLINASCSKSKNENSAQAAGGGGHTGAAAGNSNVAAPAAASSAGEAKATAWEASASSLNGTNGQSFTLACSPRGSAHSVWGSDIYTADSSICTAAVHSGLITYEQGGTVTIEVLPGRPAYGTSERNGVTTSPYGSYPQSFVFKTPNTDAILREADAEIPVMWSTRATIVSFEPGKTQSFKCPPDGKESAVWGTDIYTADSSICTAAVHAGKLKLDAGGQITIEMQAGQSSYKGSTRNGIKSIDYGAYGQSFVVK